ncbi:MAG: hypothetical protein QOI38_1885 [Sphingomonadales bacterium]|jgi:hypothetical protein|nr:hypothetical protein [Sphingomonadales bacterium]
MKTAILLAAALIFPGCAPSPADPGAAETSLESATLRLGEAARLRGVRVRVLRVVEDSRCPASVQCVQAGTVRLAARLSDERGTREVMLSLGVAEPLAGRRSLRLLAACPYPRAPGAIASADYSFLIATGADGAERPALYACPSA